MLFFFQQSSTSWLHGIYWIVLWRNESWISGSLQEPWPFISALSLPMQAPPALFFALLQTHFQDTCRHSTSRIRLPLCSGSAQTQGESVIEVALLCSKGRWLHTYADLRQISSGGLYKHGSLTQSATVLKAIDVAKFSATSSAFGGFQKLSCSPSSDWLWTLTLSSLSPPVLKLPLHHKSLAMITLSKATFFLFNLSWKPYYRLELMNFYQMHCTTSLAWQDLQQLLGNLLSCILHTNNFFLCCKKCFIIL